jgi:hypothetical protein
MRKMNFLRAVLSVATAMLLTVGVFAQNPPLPYGVFNADVTNGATHDDNTDYVTLKTAGTTTMGYYALPDPVYHPNYVTTGALTANFTWNWTLPVGVTNVSQTDNYVELQYASPGTYSITVNEVAPAAFGGCTGSTTYLHVTVINPPTGTASINPGGTWQAITPNVAYQICSDQAAQTVTVAFNEAVPDALASYSFQVTETIELLNGAGTVISTPQPETVIQDFPLNGKLKGSNLGTLPSAAFVTATPNFSYTFLTDALDVLQNLGTDARTRYTYRVTRTGAAAQNGFVSNISHKSDYIAGSVEYYNFTNQAVSFIVNPAPVTGPIYYVPNNYNY